MQRSPNTPDIESAYRPIATHRTGQEADMGYLFLTIAIISVSFA